MDPAVRSALLAVATRAAEELLKTPEVQHLISKVEEAAIDNLPGVEGSLLRFLRALAPHEVPGAVRLNHDGPG